MTPTIAERLFNARARAAVVVQLAEQSSVRADEAPPKAFWQGLALIATELEEEIAAARAALPFDATEEDAPAVAVER